MKHILLGDNLGVLGEPATTRSPLVYIDPPFNTGKVQERTRLRTVARRRAATARASRGGAIARVRAARLAGRFDDYLAFLEPRLVEARRLLTPAGSLFFHIDSREVHYCKVLLDEIFGRASFINEIIWAYDYGARRSRWPAKHDTISGTPATRRATSSATTPSTACRTWRPVWSAPRRPRAARRPPMCGGRPS